MTMGWILLLDPFSGVLNTFLRDRLGIESPFNIYSYGGIIWAHLAFSTSIRFLLLTPCIPLYGCRPGGGGPDRRGTTLAAGASRRVTIPVLAPAIIIGTSLGLHKEPRVAGDRAAPGPARRDIRIHHQDLRLPSLGAAPLRQGPRRSPASLLLVIFLLIWLQRVVIGKRHYTTVTGRGYRAGVNDIGGWRWVTFGSSMLFIGVMIILPPLHAAHGNVSCACPACSTSRTRGRSSTGPAAFDDPVFIRSLRNTLIMGFGAATLGAVVYSLIAYMIIRGRFLGKRAAGLLRVAPVGHTRRPRQPVVAVGIPRLRSLYSSRSTAPSSSSSSPPPSAPCLWAFRSSRPPSCR